MVERQDLKFRRTYTLLAQTPMIHFQHNQSGATLRPSEVKPKLDAYLLRVCGGKVPDKWLIPDQPKALNYQMRIRAHREDRSAGWKIKDHCKAYFGNMGDGANKDLVFRDCVLEIHCFIPDLLELINEHIGDFFVLHNFGTRQSKGFGGFLVKENGCSETKFVHDTVHSADFPYFYIELSQNTDDFQRINHAYVVYAVLKSGVNMSRNDPRRYIKGYSLRKFLPQDVGSDKAFIKAKVWPSAIVRPKESKKDYPSYCFIRALLGLAENYEFRDDARNGGTKTVKDKRTGELKDTLVGGKVKIAHLPSGEEKTIQRFSSPILIKITKERIFFILKDSWQDMLDKTFVFTREKTGKPEKEKHCVSTPETFDAKAFMDDFADYFNSEEVQNSLKAFPERGDGPKYRAGYEFREAYGLKLQKGRNV